MALRSSEAILLKAFNWSESSRTVIFFTRDFGKIAVVDKGGRSLKSRRGRLLPFARLEITVYHSERETRDYLRDAELIHEYAFDADGSLGRLAYASAASELLYLLLSEDEPYEMLYSYFNTFLEFITRTDKHRLPSLIVTFFLRLLSNLGYHPSLTTCVVTGKEVDREDDSLEDVHFYPERGGIIHPSCQKPVDYYIPVSRNSFRKLVLLQRSSLAEAANTKLGFSEATGLLELLVKFLSYQADIRSELKSLQFLEKLKSTDLRIEKDDDERETD